MQSLLHWESDPAAWRVTPINPRVLHSNRGRYRETPDTPCAVAAVHLGVSSPGLYDLHTDEGERGGQMG